MDKQQKEDCEMVLALAQRAGLDIPLERTPELAAILRAWTVDAVSLAQRMSASRFDTVMPITTFSHDAGDEGDAS